MCNFEVLNETIFRVYLTPNQSQSIHDHVKLFSNNSSWGTQVELIAAASYFQASIFIYEYLPTSKSGKWTCVKPINTKFNFPVTDKHHPPEQFNVPSHFELYHTSNLHYDCIVSKDTGIVPTVPPSMSTTVCWLDIQ